MLRTIGPVGHRPSRFVVPASAGLPGADGVLAAHPRQDGRAHAGGVSPRPAGRDLQQERRIASAANAAQSTGERPQLDIGGTQRRQESSQRGRGQRSTTSAQLTLPPPTHRRTERNPGGQPSPIGQPVGTGHYAVETGLGFRSSVRRVVPSHLTEAHRAESSVHNHTQHSCDPNTSVSLAPDPYRLLCEAPPQRYAKLGQRFRGRKTICSNVNHEHLLVTNN